jgi:modulator of FtsH protease HflC
MKKNPVTLVIGGLLLVIFLALLFCFQVRTTEVAVVTTFGKVSSTHTEPGLKFRLPMPIQRVYRFDKRIQNFERKYEQSYTRDKKSPIITVFVAWRISDPRIFLDRFDGDVVKAEQSLENVVRDAKNAVIGRHDFGELIAPDPGRVRFDEIEQEMRDVMDGSTRTAYGITVERVGIKQLGLPESLTAKVFERMKTERERLVKQYTSEGASEAKKIRSEAERKRDELLAKARAEARIIEGNAEAESARAYAILNEDPEFANFLVSLRAVEEALKTRATLILDDKVAPLNLLRQGDGTPVSGIVPGAGIVSGRVPMVQPPVPIGRRPGIPATRLETDAPALPPPPVAPAPIPAEQP